MAFDPAALLGALDGPQLEALIDTMVLAAAADGHISDDEQHELASRLTGLAKDTAHAEALAGGALSGRIAATYSRILGDDQGRVIDSVKKKLPSTDERKAALGLAIAVTAADGIIRTSEREIILELAEALEIDRDEAADLVRDVTRG
jgi:tellurite resistance protein